MLKSVEGVFRDGKIGLLEPVPPEARGNVIVTFLESNAVDLAARGIDQMYAADLCHRLSAIADD